MTGRTYWNLRLLFQTGTRSNRLSSGSILTPGNHSYHQLTWVDLLMRNPSKRSIPWMILPHSISILEDWQLGWPRRKELVPMTLTGPTIRAFILNYGTKF